VLRHRRDLVLAVIAAAGGAVTQTAIPLAARQIVDNVIVEQQATLWVWLLLILVLTGATFGLAYVRRYRGGRVALEVQFDLRNAMH